MSAPRHAARRPAAPTVVDELAASARAAHVPLLLMSLMVGALLGHGLFALIFGV